VPDDPLLALVFRDIDMNRFRKHPTRSKVVSA
jgi:hypothetical protein